MNHHPRPTRSLRLGHRVLTTITAAVVLAAAGCGGGGSTTTNADGTLSFTVAVIEPDITTVPILAALDAVRAEGHQVKLVELAEPELAIEGLAKGDYAFSAEATSPALIAIQRKAPIRIIADVVGNQWAVYGRTGINNCDDLAGRPFGIFSEGAVATAMAKDWVRNTCGGGNEPRYLTIGGSDVRAQALLAGEIDATPLEISDAVTLEASGKTGFTRTADFATSLPDLHPQTVYANADFIGEHREVTQLLVDALVAEHKKINENPQYLVELMGKYLPDTKDPNLAQTAQRYVDGGLFDAAALTDTNMQGTIDFFVRAGVLKEGLTVGDAADLSFVKAAR